MYKAVGAGYTQSDYIIDWQCVIELYYSFKFTLHLLIRDSNLFASCVLLFQEIKVLQNLKHHNIVQYYGSETVRFPFVSCYPVTARPRLLIDSRPIEFD